MSRALSRILCAALVLGMVSGAAHPAEIRIDDSEARAALVILQAYAHHTTPSGGDWNRLFTTQGYERLQKREAAFKRPFNDGDFMIFLSDPKTIAQTADLQRTLDKWTAADLGTMIDRARAYLPEGAQLHATIYPLIKPKTNSFVWELDTDPAVMLYLDPAVSQAQFSNTVSHELTHVGDEENCPPPAVRAEEKNLDEPHKQLLEWLSAFGEGWAVLAAAGGPDVHPHAEDPAKDRAVWDAAMANYDTDFASLQQFFGDILAGRLKGDAIATKGLTYFGQVQGPWYTVGYKMDVTIERAFGRARLVSVLCDKRKYFSTYNEAARLYNASHPDKLPLSTL